MEFTFLGTGDVRQVPVFGCDCAACLRARRQPGFRRGAASALVRCGGQTTLLDAGLPQLEERFAPGALDRILLTHYHMDHVQGLFALRWGVGPSLPVFGPPDAQGSDDLYKHPGMLAFQPPLAPFQPVELGELCVTPLPLLHSRLTFGYLLEHQGATLAYLTDTVGLPDDTRRFLAGKTLGHLILDCAFPPQDAPPRNHNDLTLALEIHRALRPQHTWLTHIGHSLDAYLMAQPLPDGVQTAADGLTLPLA